MKQQHIFSAITAFTLLSSQIFADDIFCPEGRAHINATARHREFNGIGYDMGYSSMDFFAARPFKEGSYIPFVDARAHIFNNGDPAVNAGLGFRYKTTPWIFGANTYYDYRKSPHFHYNQWSIGLEALSKRFDIRIAGYLPVGKKISSLYGTRFDHFSGHSAILSSKREFAMKGLTSEFGYHLPAMKNIELIAALGPYYFAAHGKNAAGGKARFSSTFFDILNLELSGSYDPVFQWTGQIAGAVTIALGKKHKVKKKGSCSYDTMLQRRSLQPVERQEMIVLDKKRSYSIAMNPATGLPYTFYFVNGSSSSLGTYESPFPTLAQAASASNPYDIIYVEPANIYNMGANSLTLQNYQKLWGSSAEQLLSTTLGSITIPSQSSALPVITNAGSASIIVNASYNEISGVHLGTSNLSSSNNAINISSACSNATIQNCFFEGGFNGYNIVYWAGSGDFIFANNTFDCQINSGNGAVHLDSNSGATTALVYNNQFYLNLNYQADAIESYLRANSSLNIFGNIFSINCLSDFSTQNNYGIYLQNSSLQGKVWNNQIAMTLAPSANESMYGIYSTSEDNTSYDILNNTITMIGSSTTVYAIEGITLSNGTAVANILGNNVSVAGQASYLRGINSNVNGSDLSVITLNKVRVPIGGTSIYPTTSTGNISVYNNDTGN